MPDTPAAPPAPALHCSQCGGELQPEAGQIFVTCPYCATTVYLDRAQVVFHWAVNPTVDETQAAAALRRWMAGNQTVKDLDQKARLTGQSFEYFPLWYFKRKPAGGSEQIYLEPAAATSVSELARLNLPVGELKKYRHDLDSQARPPTVPLQTALGWLAEQQVSAGEVVEKALVHIPVFTFHYEYQGRSYLALVEAATGGVFANIYPAKANAPYLLAGGITALVYLCLALIPLGGLLAVDPGALGLGVLICSGAGLAAAPFLFTLAAWVAAKV
jgi:hypothetical protein